MKKFKEFIMRKVNENMRNFALAFAEGSVQRICFYIFHQPKMPGKRLNLKSK